MWPNFRSNIMKFQGIQLLQVYKLPLILSKPNRRSSERGIYLFASLQKKLTNRKMMLKAGLIQVSTSDWAFAPVFIRKQDGSLRWCIGYRILKEETVKEMFIGANR